LSANQYKYKKQIMPKPTDQEIFDELKNRWRTRDDRLTASQQRTQQMNNHPAWYVTCPKCQEVGSRMGRGKQGNHVLLCPNCEQCYPLGQLIKEFAQDLHYEVTRATTDHPYEKASKTKTSHPRKPRRSAEEREELKRQAKEIRRGLMISPTESSNPF
jgi:uncharacterized protein YbaR (Trm112 family)